MPADGRWDLTRRLKGLKGKFNLNHRFFLHVVLGKFNRVTLSSLTKLLHTALRMLEDSK